MQQDSDTHMTREAEHKKRLERIIGIVKERGKVRLLNLTALIVYESGCSDSQAMKDIATLRLAEKIKVENNEAFI